MRKIFLKFKQCVMLSPLLAHSILFNHMANYKFENLVKTIL